jgi:protein-arginine kinase activator protein McsA
LSEPKPPLEEHAVDCQKCGYRWTTKSLMPHITCPHCLRKTYNPYSPMHKENLNPQDMKKGKPSNQKRIAILEARVDELEEMHRLKGELG